MSWVHVKLGFMHLNSNKFSFSMKTFPMKTKWNLKEFNCIAQYYKSHILPHGTLQSVRPTASSVPNSLANETPRHIWLSCISERLCVSVCTFGDVFVTYESHSVLSSMLMPRPKPWLSTLFLGSQPTGRQDQKQEGEISVTGIRRSFISSLPCQHTL